MLFVFLLSGYYYNRNFGCNHIIVILLPASEFSARWPDQQVCLAKRACAEV